MGGEENDPEKREKEKGGERGKIQFFKTRRQERGISEKKRKR